LGWGDGRGNRQRCRYRRNHVDVAGPLIRF
jgi:hypothetical protein